MAKWLFWAGGVAAVALGLYQTSRRRQASASKKPTASFRLRCHACGRDLLVETGRHFADPTDAESIPAHVSCPHCQGQHAVAYSSAGTLHAAVLLPPPPAESQPRKKPWNPGFSNN